MPNLPVPAAATGLPNRRIFLAGGSAGAVMGALSQAAALASPEVSPGLLDLIEAYRRADALIRSASDEEDEAHDRFREALAQIEFHGIPYDPYSGDHGRGDLVKSLDCDRRSIWNGMRQARVSERRRFDALFDEVVKERLSRFDQLHAEIEAKKVESGFDRANQALAAANAAHDEILLQICAWRCAAEGDGRAKAGVLVELAGMLNESEVEALVRSIGGLPPRTEG